IYPQQRAVTMAAEDTVSYAELVATMDTVAADDIPDISDTPAID
ncbi:MAG: hypothetical protein JWM85_2001, partial [Acidimicrobiaceae bacterium]|nr:hypothetical protein [Acidimicrobiaceae bacterium]